MQWQQGGRRPDCTEPGISWQCPAAVIVQVVDPVVLLRTRTPKRWLRMLTGGTR